MARDCIGFHENLDIISGVARWLLAMVGLAWVASTARGELFTSEQTLGCRMANSDCVVRAIITGSKIFLPPNLGRTEVLRKILVQLDVQETFKGPAATSLTFLTDDFQADRIKSIKTEQLFFLQTSRRAFEGHTPGSKYIKLAAWADTDLFDGPIGLTPDTFQGPIITDDLRVLHSVDETLEAARRLGRTNCMVDRSTRILLPESVAARLGLNRGEWLEVGLNDETFKSAREWIRSPDPQMQWCGAEVLVHQRSPENAASLRNFAWSMQEARRYGPDARARLLGVLSRWGAGGVPPLVKASPFFDSRQSSAWLSLVGFLLIPGIYVAWNVRRRIRILAFIGWALLSAVIVLGIRSYWPRDAITWGNFDLAFERGNLFLERQSRASVGLPSPLLVCKPQELLKVQDASCQVPMSGQLNNLGEIGSGLFFDSYARKYWPFQGSIPWNVRLRSSIVEIPLWLIAAVLIIPRLGIISWKRLRKLRSQARGFPIEIVK